MKPFVVVSADVNILMVRSLSGRLHIKLTGKQSRCHLLSLMPLSLSLLDVLLGTLGLFLLHHILVGGRTRAPLPPGPQGLPIIGNVLDMPKSYEWQTYIEWSKKWGEAVFVYELLSYAVLIADCPLSQATSCLSRCSGRLSSF